MAIRITLVVLERPNGAPFIQNFHQDSDQHFPETVHELASQAAQMQLNASEQVEVRLYDGGASLK